MIHVTEGETTRGRNDSGRTGKWAKRPVSNTIAEPKYKHGQQEQVTVRNHKRGTALERSV